MSCLHLVEATWDRKRKKHPHSLCNSIRQVNHLNAVTACMDILGRDIVLKTDNWSSPLATCARNIPSCPCTGRGCIMSRDRPACGCYAGVRGSPSTACFIYFCAICSADNLTLRMSTVYLLFVPAFLLLLALENLRLSRIIVLALSHTCCCFLSHYWN